MSGTHSLARSRVHRHHPILWLRRNWLVFPLAIATIVLLWSVMAPR